MDEQVPRSGSEANAPEITLLEFACGHCGTDLVTGSQFAGVEASCPHCWKPTRAPGAGAGGEAPCAAVVAAGASGRSVVGEGWSPGRSGPWGGELDPDAVPPRESFQARHRIPVDQIVRESPRRRESIRREARKRKKRRELDQAIGSMVGTGRFRRWRRRLSLTALLFTIVGVTYMAMNNWQIRPLQAGEEPGLAHRIAELLSGRPAPAAPAPDSAAAGGLATGGGEAATGPLASPNADADQREEPGSLASRPIEGNFRWGE